MKLINFRVQNFRSIHDSGWISTDNVTSLVGVNEAGKSNLLLALWKINPATDGEINKLEDMPRASYSKWRNLETQPIFITCKFQIESSELLEQLSHLTDCDIAEISVVEISRDYSGERFIDFTNYKEIDTINSSEIISVLEEYLELLQSSEEKGKTEQGLKRKIIEAIESNLVIARNEDSIDLKILNSISDNLNIQFQTLQKSVLQPKLHELQGILEEFGQRFQLENPSHSDEVHELIINSMPKFVYYSNYGNLDSEIYLPHVIDNMKRTDLSPQMQAKTRTLKVLFEFVSLDPKEILELGEDDKYDSNRRRLELSEKEVEDFAKKKSERDVLLQSAGLSLTKEFAKWWRQGNYKFRFQADGKHFKIWVSDDKRPEEISLEGRSTGLQWFLSFYLIFLVESRDSHDNAILLLDEAGVSLHPIAQKDLVSFFESLSLQNQLIHTTHSPFLIDTENIDRVKVVYMDEGGKTVSSNDLRAAESKSSKTNSVYAVHAALGLSVSDILLQGCKIVIVEGPSDQYYLNGIKNYLMSDDLFHPKEEVIFIPSGGVKGIKPISSILSGKDEKLPTIIIDSDSSGKGQKDSLLQTLYKEYPNRIIEIEELLGIEQAEVEDLIPIELMEKFLNKMSLELEEDFIDIYNETMPIIPQIEKFFKDNEIELKKGWKVDLARNVKQSIHQPRQSKHINENLKNIWVNLFKKIFSD